MLSQALPQRTPGAGPQIPTRTPIQFGFVADHPELRAEMIVRVCSGLAAARKALDEDEPCADQ